VRRAINRQLGRHPQHLRKSITYDNGAENVEHMLTNKAFDTKSYFPNEVINQAVALAP